MKNKLSILVLLLVVTIPQVASASWWNPFSWKIFSRIFSPKVETIQEIISTENIASSTGEVSEIEKLRAELEELKSQKNDSSSQKTTPTTQTSTKQSTPTVTSTPAPQTTKTMSKDEIFVDVMQKYTTFQSVITSERGGLAKNSSLASERQYFIYLDGLLVKINADLGYLNSIKGWNPRPAGIEEIYLSKFSKLKSEYDIKAKQYIVEREQDRLSSIASQEQAEKEVAAQAILDQQKNVQDIKVKIAEMDQLRTQIDTLAGSSLINILNTAKKLDGNPLFYSFTYNAWGSYQFNYPYEQNSCGGGCAPQIREKLQAIVANYRAFLNVELAKNQ